MRMARQKFAERRALLTGLACKLSDAFRQLAGEGQPLFNSDSDPVDVCRPKRAGDKQRLSGLAQHGYCASLDEYFYGVREHLIFTSE